MTSEHIKREILIFMNDTWTSADYERQEAIGSGEGDRSVDQPAAVDALDVETIYAADHIRRLVERDSLFLMDKEGMTQWRASGLYVREDGGLVIFHER